MGYSIFRALTDVNMRTRIHMAFAAAARPASPVASGCAKGCAPWSCDVTQSTIYLVNSWGVDYPISKTSGPFLKIYYTDLTFNEA
jgi:hypothetical protein